MKKIMKSILIMMVVTISIFATDNQSTQKVDNKDKIKIDIVSDVVCPWCAIGYQRLSQAINELDLKDKVEIQWHPFELNPNMPREGQNADKYLMKKLRLSEEGLKQKRKTVAKIGEDSGFKFDYFTKMKKVNTFNAHVLLDYAKEFNKQTELKVRLQNAYFNERKDVNDRNILALEVEKVGLNVAEAMARLDNKEAIKRVEDEEKYWKDRGVFAIPTMIFNDKIVRRGANKVESYKKLLQELINNKG